MKRGGALRCFASAQISSKFAIRLIPKRSVDFVNYPCAEIDCFAGIFGLSSALRSGFFDHRFYCCVFFDHVFAFLCSFPLRRNGRCCMMFRFASALWNIRLRL